MSRHRTIVFELPNTLLHIQKGGTWRVGSHFMPNQPRFDSCGRGKEIGFQAVPKDATSRISDIWHYLATSPIVRPHIAP